MPVTPVRKKTSEPRTSVVRELHPRRAMTDALLVTEIQGGSSTAAGVLFDRYGAHVERLLWSLLGPESEAEDLLHEIFVRALEGIGSVEDPSRLRSWLNGI